MSRASIRVDLQAPACVNGAAAAPQSLWFAMRLWVIANEANPTERWLRSETLRERSGPTRNPRMMISRAFADFAHWGLRVGWGMDPTRDPALLAIGGRSRGPFWLAAGEAERLQPMLGTRSIGLAEVREWLECAQPTTPIEPAADSVATASASYWNAWALAKRRALDGRLLGDGSAGALSNYRLAQSLATHPYHEALALLQQAIVWRRAGNADAARKALAQIHQDWRDAQAPEHAWLGAMTAVVLAWCAYTERDLVAARRILATACADPRWRDLFEFHPRVRAEHANLQALICRAIALDERGTPVEREAAAHAAIQHYQRALAVAGEADYFDAAASAASNLGWTLWLFRRTGLRLDPAPGSTALQWIALAAALAEQHHVGGGSWNDIYLLRMVRDGGPTALHPGVAEFRSWPVLEVSAFREAIQPIRWTGSARHWRELAADRAAAASAGKLDIDALQQANLLLEWAWYEAHSGDLGVAAQASAKLRRRLRELLPAERQFFRDALRRLP